MKFFRIFALVAFTAILFSCVSAPPEPEKEVEVVKPEEPAPPPVVVVKEKTPLEKFNEIWEGARLSVASAPKEITKGKEFSAPYVIKASKPNGNPCAGLEIEVSYPVSRMGEEVAFEKMTIKTDDAGIAQFMPDKPARPYYSEVIFAPVFNEPCDESIAAEIERMTVKAPYRVKTNMKSSGGSIAIVDFDSNGKPITTNSQTSSNLLMTLMSKGFTGIGNADFLDAIVSGDENRVYREAKDFFGGEGAFLVFGTVKYISPVTKENNVYTCSLKGEITAYDLRSGALLTRACREITYTDKSEYGCLLNGRKLLAEELSEAVIYGL